MSSKWKQKFFTFFLARCRLYDSPTTPTQSSKRVYDILEFLQANGILQVESADGLLVTATNFHSIISEPWTGENCLQKHWQKPTQLSRTK